MPDSDGYQKQSSEYVGIYIKNQTKDGATIVFPDSTEIHARTDPRLQRLADSLRKKTNELVQLFEKGK